MRQRDARHPARELATRRASALLGVAEDRGYPLDGNRAAGDNAVAELSRHTEHPRSVRSDIQWNRSVEIYEAQVAMEITDLAAQPLGIVNRLAVFEQIPDH